MRASWFANTGTTKLPIFEQFADGAAGLELIVCSQEAFAVGAARAHAKATNRPALVNLHILPGLANYECSLPAEVGVATCSRWTSMGLSAVDPEPR